LRPAIAEMGTGTPRFKRVGERGAGRVGEGAGLSLSVTNDSASQSIQGTSRSSANFALPLPSQRAVAGRRPAAGLAPPVAGLATAAGSLGAVFELGAGGGLGRRRRAVWAYRCPFSAAFLCVCVCVRARRY
jgi:hypothetical protein